MASRDTFTVQSVDELFAIAEGLIRTACRDGSMLVIDRASYLEGKANVGKVLGVAAADVNFVGMTLTLDDDRVPALPE